MFLRFLMDTKCSFLYHGYLKIVEAVFSVTGNTIRFFLPQTFQPTSPHNPYQTLCSRRKVIWIQVYVNTSFCLVLHNTSWPVHRINQQINTIFTALHASLARTSKPIPSPHLAPPPRFHFLQSHPISHTWQFTTHATYISPIYGVRMPTPHSKPAHIHNNTISKFIPRHHYDKETSIFRWDS